MDETPPPGRIQGPTDPLLASEAFRKAVPDLRGRADDRHGHRAVLHLHMRGHFTGTFDGRRGQGQPVSFIAANWHIEDNLTLLRQLGAVPNP